MKRENIKKMVPDNVYKRFEQLNAWAKSGTRKVWTLKNTSEEFKPFKNFDKKTNELFNSPIIKHLEKKINEYG